jgi:hypothetical protein
VVWDIPEQYAGMAVKKSVFTIVMFVELCAVFGYPFARRFEFPDIVTLLFALDPLVAQDLIDLSRIILSQFIFSHTHPRSMPYTSEYHPQSPSKNLSLNRVQCQILIFLIREEQDLAARRGDDVYGPAAIFLGNSAAQALSGGEFQFEM